MTKEIYCEEHWKKNVMFFLLGQGITLIGSSLVSYAIMWHVILKTQSGTVMTAFVIATMLPMFFIAPFGGVWADRFNKKYLINIADGAIAMITLCIAICFSFGIDSIAILFGCAVVRSAGQGIQMPAVSSLIPEIVPQDNLLRINGINSSIQSISSLGAPALAGVLMSFAPMQTVFFIDVFTAIIGISILFFIVKTPSKTQEEKEILKNRTYFFDIKEGIKYILGHSFIKRFMVIAIFFYFLLSPPMFLSVLQVTRNFGPQIWKLSVLELAFAIGMLIGGLIIAYLGGFKNKTLTIVFGTILFGISTVGLGLSGNFWIYLAFIIVSGLTVPIFNTPLLSIFQIKINEEYMGRVMSVISMISSLIVPLGMLIFGPLGDTVSIDIIMIGSGIATIILGAYMFRDKILMEAGK